MPDMEPEVGVELALDHLRRLVDYAYDGYHEHGYDPLKAIIDERARLQRLVMDLQSGMQVNCVYCGYNYGPSKSTPMVMADVLKRHIERCPAHPMSKLKIKLLKTNQALRKLLCARDELGRKVDGLIGEELLSEVTAALQEVEKGDG